MSDEWVLAEGRHVAELAGMLPGSAGRILGPDDPVDPERVEALRLYGPADDPVERWFPRIGEFGRLRQLTLGPVASRALIASITPGAIPASVSALGIFTGGQPTAWPRDVVLPGVASLRADGQLMLGRDAFPRVRAVALKPARNNQNLYEVLAIPSLRELHLMTVPPGVFGLIGSLPLTGLGLLGGRLSTLDGIEALTGLVSLRLHNLRSLRSIAALRGLGLETVQIRYCTGITDLDVLGTLPRLRRLQLIGYDEPAVDRLRASLDGVVIEG